MTEDLRESDLALGDEGNRRDLAYWRELLRNAPPTASIAGRRSVAAPAGAGRNRGDLGIFETSIAGTNPPRAEHLLAAYATALRKTFSITKLIVDNWFTERDPVVGATSLGPVDSFYPLLLLDGSLVDEELVHYIRRMNAQAVPHRKVDTPALLQELTEDLREREISLRQFGFAFIDNEQATLLSVLDSPLDTIEESLHEIQLSAAAGDTECSIRLKVDIDVVSKATAEALLSTTLAELAAICGEADLMQARDPVWSVRRWPDLPDFTTKSEVVVKLVGIANVHREIPIATTQRAWLDRIAQSSEFDNSEAVGTLSLAFKISPSPDRRRFAQAMKAIVARHEVMRTRFVEQNGTWHAYHERLPSQVLFIEAVASEAAAHERAQELMREGVRVTGSLFKIVVIDTCEGSDVVVAMAHHIVADGYSLGLIVEEAFQAYLGMELPKIDMDIDRFVAEFDHAGNPESLERRNKFLQDMFADPPPLPNIGRKAKGLAPNHGRSQTENGGRMVALLSPERQSKVRDRAMASGTTEAALVMAAYADTLATLGGVDEVILSVPTARRHSRRLEYYANNIASDVPVRIRPSASRDIANLAAVITAKIDEASAYAPFIDAMWAGEFYESILSKGSYSNIYVAGEVTSRRWTENSVSGSFQRPGADGAIEMGPATIEILPGLSEKRLDFREIDLRSLSTPDGLTITMRYDTIGFTEEEAQHFLDEVVSRVEQQ